jgi:hypothetical protein
MSASYNRDMDQQREVEFLLHIAAGTDPLTALAALPREKETEPTPSAAEPATTGKLDLLSWIVLIAFGLLTCWVMAM